MDAIPYSDQDDEVARLYGRSSGEITAARADQAGWLPRWLATSGSRVVGGVSGFRRPDDRWFARFVGDPVAIPALADAFAAELAAPLHAMVPADDETVVAAFRSAGFRVSVQVDRFAVRFDDLLSLVGRAFVPRHLRIRSVVAVDEESAFVLDNRLRADVPGSDGWRGDRQWFHDEIHDDPAFDAAAYLVAQVRSTGDLVGLIRFWRNPAGPRLGLIGVLPEFRGRVLAAALLKQAAAAASSWGHPDFETETSTHNERVHPRLSALAHRSLGRSLQLIRRESEKLADADGE